MTDYSYGVVDSDVLKSYDGLGFLKAIIAGTLPQPPISEIMGFHLTEAEPGRVVFEGLPNLQHYNPIGSVHGGFAATLLDSALGCAIFSTLHKGDAWTTLELKLNYMRGMSHDTGPVRRRPHHSSRPHRSDLGRRFERRRRQALRARHDDVHDLPGEKLKLSLASREYRRPCRRGAA